MVACAISAPELAEYLPVFLGMNLNGAVAPRDLVGAALGRHEDNPALGSAADSLGSIGNICNCQMEEQALKTLHIP